MGYGSWGRVRDREPRAFDEKAFRRAPVPPWDDAWHQLSVAARRAFLDDVKAPRKSTSARQVGISKEKFAPKVLDELTAAGFVAIRPGGLKSRPDRVVSAIEPPDFVGRIQALRRHHLLAVDPPPDLLAYLKHCFYGGVTRVLYEVLSANGIEDHASDEALLSRYVVHRRWPGWVEAALKDPLVGRLLTAAREADGPTPLVKLLSRVGGKPAEARAALDRLVGRWALFEDLDPKTLDIRVGLLPAVLEELTQADQPRHRPPLEPRATPVELGPEEGPVVGDLRGFLLELASAPAQLRQDRMMFQKEVSRFLVALDPLPDWLVRGLKWSDEFRVNQAHTWARNLGLVADSAEGKRIHLQLASQGREWLANGLDQQYAAVYDFLRPLKSPREVVHRFGLEPGNFDDFDNLDDFEDEMIGRIASPYYGYGSGDLAFLGSPLTVLKIKTGKRPSAWMSKPQDRKALRDAIDRAFAEVPAGVYYPIKNLADHLAFGDANPLLLGQAQDQVAVFLGDRIVPPLEERREEVGQQVLETLIFQRLIPLGCVRTAVDNRGQPCVARTPRLDAYFGRKVAPAETSANARSIASLRALRSWGLASQGDGRLPFLTLRTVTGDPRKARSPLPYP